MPQSPLDLSHVFELEPRGGFLRVHGTGPVHARIEGILADLEGQLLRTAKIEAHLHNRDRTLPQDWSDMAQVLENDEVLESLGNSSEQELSMIKFALMRLDEGSYFQCAECGNDVGAELRVVRLVICHRSSPSLSRPTVCL